MRSVRSRSQCSFLSLAVECLEERLTPSWTSVPPATLKLPEAAESIVQNPFGDANGTGSVDGNEIHWYQFIAIGSGATIFKATTPDSNLNTILAVYNSTGARMGLSDNISLTNTDSQLTVNVVKGQHYWFGITNITGTEGGSYSWSLNGLGNIKLPSDDRYENNDTRATAANLGTITTERTFEKLVMLDGHDWYRFTLAKPGTPESSAAIYFLNSIGDLDLQLHNSNGALLRTSTGGGDSETVSLEGLAAGTYYLHVIGFDGAINTDYSLVITPQASLGAPGFTIQLRMTGLTLAQQAVFNQAAARWQQIIISDLPNMNYNGVNVDDLLIEASATAIDGVDGILGQAAPDRFRSGSNLPYHGFMEFDTADLASLQASGQLQSVILHEMGHVLGIGTIWEEKGLLFGAGTSDPVFIGQQARAEYNSIFHKNAFGVPVENSGGGGTRDSHWRETLLVNELMTGYLNNGFNPLSRITIASLADLGYAVNITKADNYVPTGSLATGSSTGASGAALRLALTELLPSTTRPAVPLADNTIISALLTPSATTATTPSATDTTFVQMVIKPIISKTTTMSDDLLASVLTSRL